MLRLTRKQEFEFKISHIAENKKKSRKLRKKYKQAKTDSMWSLFSCPPDRVFFKTTLSSCARPVGSLFCLQFRILRFRVEIPICEVKKLFN